MRAIVVPLCASTTRCGTTHFLGTLVAHPNLGLLLEPRLIAISRCLAVLLLDEIRERLKPRKLLAHSVQHNADAIKDAVDVDLLQQLCAAQAPPVSSPSQHA